MYFAFSVHHQIFKSGTGRTRNDNVDIGIFMSDVNKRDKNFSSFSNRQHIISNSGFFSRPNLFHVRNVNAKTYNGIHKSNFVSVLIDRMNPLFILLITIAKWIQFGRFLRPRNYPQFMALLHLLP